MPGVPARASSRARLGCRWRRPKRVSVKGDGSLMSAGGSSARPAGALSLPFGSLAGKPPDGELTGPPEGCPVGSHHPFPLFRAFQTLPSAVSFSELPSTLFQLPELLSSFQILPHAGFLPLPANTELNVGTGSDNMGAL